MKTWKQAALALAGAGLLSAQAQATEAQVSPLSVAAFSQADMHAMFEPVDKPVEVVALSSVEMKETEGAFFNFGTAAFGGFVGGAGYAWSVHRGNTTWNTSRFLGNIGTGALIGGTFGAAGAAASGGARFVPSLTNAGANIWRFNRPLKNPPPTPVWAATI